MNTPPKEEKFRCKTCNMVTLIGDLLSAPNPFDPCDVIHGCPKCREVWLFDALCEIPGCRELVAGGIPFDDGGYGFYCSKHLREHEQRKDNNE